MKILRYKANRKLNALERAVVTLKTRFDELQRIQPEFNEHLDIFDRSLLGDLAALQTLRSIARSERRFNTARRTVNRLVAEAECAIANAAYGIGSDRPWKTEEERNDAIR